jgi:succinate dehydrogenase/fumarate reductase flavoprotein subunit
LCEPWGYDGGIAELERILIVGGGIAGLSLATALQRKGFAPARAPAARPGRGRRYGIGGGPALEVFGQQAEPLCITDLEASWQEVGP